MNQKAFAIFVGLLMVLSGIAYFLPLGTQQNTIVPLSESNSPGTFGVQGNLIDWSFDGLADVLEMAPPNTEMAYWINMNASPNLTEAARIALPQSIGLNYGERLYPKSIERLGVARFNDTWAEFHWIEPYPIGYDGFVIPYEGYMILPASSDFSMVMGSPVLFGPQEAVRDTLDVISGGQPAENFTLVDQSIGDLQVAALGRGGSSMPLSGGYKEFYLTVANSTADRDGFNMTARYIEPTEETSQRVSDLALDNSLEYTADGSDGVLSGFVPRENIRDVLAGLLWS